MSGYYEPQLMNGYKFDEVASALQKCVRRGLEFDACYFAAIFYKSGFRGYLSRRLQVIAHEDIGIANPQALILANQLYLDEIYKQKDKERYQKTKLSGDGLLSFINVVIIMCRGEKTRMGDELVNILQDGIDKGDLRLEVPEYAIDPHTDKGKEIWGRWESGTLKESQTRIKNWFDSWSLLVNEWKGFNPYHEILKRLWGYYSGDTPIKDTHYVNVAEQLRDILNNE